MVEFHVDEFNQIEEENALGEKQVYVFHVALNLWSYWAMMNVSLSRIVSQKSFGCHLVEAGIGAKGYEVQDVMVSAFQST